MNKTTKTILITTAVGATLIIGISVLLKYGVKRVTKKNYLLKTIGDSIYTIPETPFKKVDVVVIYGGLHYATPNWMFKEISKYTPDLLYSNIFIFLPYSASLNQQEELIKQATKDKVVNTYSLIGFSKGGEAVVTLKNFRKWRFVGLIDPSIGWNYKNRSWGKETVMTYGSKAMMDIYESNGKRYTDISKLIKSGRGKVEKTVSDHALAPREFFTKFENKINHGA